MNKEYFFLKNRIAVRVGNQFNNSTTRAYIRRRKQDCIYIVFIVLGVGIRIYYDIV